MHKGVIENKAAKPLIDVFTAPDGRQVHRSDLEDLDRPGYLRRGMLLEPAQFMAACHFRMKTTRGDTLELIEPSRDPFEVNPTEAPAELREAVETAQKEYDDAKALADKAEKVLAEIEKKQRRALLTGYINKAKTLNPEIEKVRKVWLQVREELHAALVKYNTADLRLKKWCEREKIRRRQSPALEIEEARKRERDEEARRERARILGP